jgi:general stress protein YciG
MSNDNSKRGFGSMDAEKQREIASKGGKAGGGDHASHEQHVEAGRKGGGDHASHEQHVKAGQQSHKNS